MWVKICGVRDEKTAEQICQLAPDAIGLNFYSGSPRAVSREIARRIAALTGNRVQRVGVFVNHSIDEVESLAEECRLDAVQLHGDESPEFLSEVCSRLRGVSVFRAWRMDGESLDGLALQLAACDGYPLAGCLIDSRVAGAYGGTGHAVPWNVLVRIYPSGSWPPLILAGGLHADNVAEAIRLVRPWGVDVASGVESAPGVKDLELIRRFISNARAAGAM